MDTADIRDSSYYVLSACKDYNCKYPLEITKEKEESEYYFYWKNITLYINKESIYYVYEDEKYGENLEIKYNPFNVWIIVYIISEKLK